MGINEYTAILLDATCLDVPVIECHGFKNHSIAQKYILSCILFFPDLLNSSAFDFLIFDKFTKNTLTSPFSLKYPRGAIQLRDAKAWYVIFYAINFFV